VFFDGGGLFWNPNGFKGAKIDGVSRVTKLNRNFWIILLLPKEKKRNLLKNRITFTRARTHTHTYYTFTTLYDYVYVPYIRPRQNTWRLQLPGQPVRWFMESRFDSIFRMYSYMVVLHARWWRCGSGGKKVTMARIGWRWWWIDGRVRVDTEEGIRIIKLCVCKCGRGVKRIQRISILLLYIRVSLTVKYRRKSLN